VRHRLPQAQVSGIGQGRHQLSDPDTACLGLNSHNGSLRGKEADGALEDLRLPVLELLPDGSCRPVPVSPAITGKKREELIEAARRGEDLDEGKARHVRVVEYEVPEREGDGKHELSALVTTITDYRLAPAAELAAASFFGGVQCPAQAGEVDHSEQAGVAGGWQVTEMPGRHDRGGVTVVVMAGRVVITA